MRNFILIMTLFFFVGCYKNEYTWNTKNDKIVFECNDILKVYGISNRPNSVKIFLTESGAKKICQFTTKNINKEITMFLNNKKINSKIKILEPINCDFKENMTSIRTNFNSKKELEELAKALCIHSDD